MPKRKRSYQSKSDRMKGGTKGNRSLGGSVKRSYREGEANRAQPNPRPLSQQQQTLMALYSHCQLEMTPQEFYSKWEVTQQEVASVCLRSLSTVQCWFTNGRRHRPPHPNDLRHLALMDFLLEHFEEIPKPLFDLLCPPK